MYQYSAVVQKVIDGDTMEIDIDLGLSVWIRSEKIRLYGIDTPEVYGVKKGSPEWELGNKSSEFVKMVVKEKDVVIVDTIKDKKEKYGRYLALVFIKIDANALSGLTNIRSIGDYHCLNDILIGKGLARPYMI
ncbi:MAG: thermonuclease family protein [Bacteroidota bacterium]|nr:thermonuclease family protein [Bacteroidota bacterium]